MKGIWKDMLTALLMGLILPGCLLNLAAAVRGRETALPLSGETAVQETAAKTAAETAAKTVSLPMLLRKSDGTVEPRNMETYLVGVVLAEMPASFEPEALKAQAVAARTYTQKAYATGGKHGDGSVCTDSGCCQAWISENAYLTRGGTQEGIDQIRVAVEATSGCVLTYGGELIEATYFSCSGGSTEDAAAVWGVDYPYLQAVDSPGEEEAAHYMDTVTFTAQAFQDALGVALTGSPRSWIGTTTYTEGGGVDSMTIGGEVYTGTRLRSLLELRSTAFTVLAAEDSITITTRGYGHRVGMSQYGADAMAVTGSSYREILAHYYPGTELAEITAGIVDTE